MARLQRNKLRKPGLWRRLADRSELHSTGVPKGDVIIVRYADDIVLDFQRWADAVRFLLEFKERLGKFGLELHPNIPVCLIHSVQKQPDIPE